MTEQEEFDSGLEEAKKLVRLLFNEDPEDEELPSGAALAPQTETGEKLPEPGIIYFGLDPTFFNSAEEKEKLVRIIQDVTRKSDAIWCFISVRAWFAEARNRRELPTSLANYPGRKEVKLLRFEHKNLGAKTLVAPIINENGKNILGEFEELPDDTDMRFKLFDRGIN